MKWTSGSIDLPEPWKSGQSIIIITAGPHIQRCRVSLSSWFPFWGSKVNGKGRNHLSALGGTGQAANDWLQMSAGGYLPASSAAHHSIQVPTFRGGRPASFPVVIGLQVNLNQCCLSLWSCLVHQLITKMTRYRMHSTYVVAMWTKGVFKPQTSQSGYHFNTEL